MTYWILKHICTILVNAHSLSEVFNAILSNSLYPSQWKMDILTPIHKSGEKSDPNSTTDHEAEAINTPSEAEADQFPN